MNQHFFEYRELTANCDAQLSRSCVFGTLQTQDGMRVVVYRVSSHNISSQWSRGRRGAMVFLCFVKHLSNWVGRRGGGVPD